MTQRIGLDPRVGSHVAGYRIEDLLGRGGMSVVYLGYDPGLDRQVALKLIVPQLARDERFRGRFLRESQLAASLDHPNVIPIYEAGEVDGVLFIAMRYVEGTDLKRLLAEERTLEPKRAVGILESVADALDAAHERGLVHRDVKPGNVLISRDGGREHVYLSDFGLSTRVQDESGLAEVGALMGTLDYLAPEQITGGSVSGQADVYALSCVLYRCLTGTTPFRAASTLAVLYAHLEQEPEPASARKSGLPRKLDDVFAKGLAKEPAARFATCADLVDQSRDALGLRRAIDTLAEVPKGRRRWLPVVALAVFVSIVAAASVSTALVLDGDDQAVAGEEWSRVADASSFAGSRDLRAWALAENDGTFVAVGTEGLNPEQDVDGAAWASTDGINWTRARSAGLGGPAGQFLLEVTAGPSGFVAVGSEERRITESDLDVDAAVWRSADGTRWARVGAGDPVFSGPGTSWQFMTDITRGGPGYVAVGWDRSADGGAAVWTSPDGWTWTRVPHDAESFAPRFRGDVFDFAQMLGVAAASDGRLVAVGHDTKALYPGQKAAAVWVSTGGETWSRVPHDDSLFGDPSVFAQMDDVVAGGPGFVAVGTEGDRLGVVGDRFPFISELFRDSPSGIEVLETGTFRGAIWTSPDGLTWVRVPVERLPAMDDIDVRLHAVTTGGPGLVAVGWRGTGELLEPIVWTSPDGETWSAATDVGRILGSAGGRFMADVVAGGPGLVAVGADGTPVRAAAAVWASP